MPYGIGQQGVHAAIKLWRNITESSEPGFPRFLDLPQELIDIILDMALLDQAASLNTIDTRMASSAVIKSGWLKFVFGKFDPFKSEDVPLVIPAVPVVFHLNHAIRNNLMRRHKNNIQKLFFPGRGKGYGPWIYRPPHVDWVRISSPVALTDNDIVHLMKSFSGELLLESAVVYWTMTPCTAACIPIHVPHGLTHRKEWEVQLFFKDGNETTRNHIINSGVEQPLSGGKVNWASRFR